MTDLGIVVGIVGGAVGILSPIVGWGALLYQNGKNRGSVDTKVKADIESIKNDNSKDHEYIKESIDNLNKTIGNGGVSGLKGKINDMQIHCAHETAEIRARLSNIDAKLKENR